VQLERERGGSANVSPGRKRTPSSAGWTAGHWADTFSRRRSLAHSNSCSPSCRGRIQLEMDPDVGRELLSL
jgi:hypothetical protein